MAGPACNPQSDAAAKPMFPGDCGKPKELEVGDRNGSFMGFDLGDNKLSIPMTGGKGMASAKGSGRNDMKGMA